MLPAKYIPVILFFVFTACETDVRNARIPEYEPELVVSSFLSPSDSVVNVNLSLTRRIFGDLSDAGPEGDISVFISDGEKEVELKHNGLHYFAQKTEMSVIPGKTFSLRILSDNYPEITSSCRIPENAGLQIKADTFYVDVSGPWGSWKEYRARITFMDQPEKDNYYRTVARYISYNFPDGFPGYIENEILELENDLVSDKISIQGEEINYEARMYHPGSYADSAFLKIYVYNTAESYYLYHKSLMGYDYDQNPFTEPTPVYTNINGGVGIFTAYTVDSLIMRLK